MIYTILWLVGLSVLAVIAYALTFHYSPLLKKPLPIAAWLVSSLSMFLWLFFDLSFFNIINETWLIRIRALWGIEFSVIFLGIFCALLQQRTIKRKLPRDPFSRHNGLVLALLLIVPSYIQPIILPYEHNFVDQWKGGVCMQSNGYTCGPATVATMLKHYGIDTTEEEVSKHVFLSQNGSVAWFLARHLRRHGLKVKIVPTASRPVDPPVPCIACARLEDKKGINHVIVLFDKTDTTFVIGDPLGGRFEWTKEKTYDNYYFTGSLLLVTQ